MQVVRHDSQYSVTATGCTDIRFLTHEISNVRRRQGAFERELGRCRCETRHQPESDTKTSKLRDVFLVTQTVGRACSLVKRARQASGRAFTEWKPNFPAPGVRLRRSCRG